MPEYERHRIAHEANELPLRAYPGMQEQYARRVFTRRTVRSRKCIVPQYRGASLCVLFDQCHDLFLTRRINDNGTMTIVTPISHAADGPRVDHVTPAIGVESPLKARMA